MRLTKKSKPKNLVIEIERRSINNVIISINVEGVDWKQQNFQVGETMTITVPERDLRQLLEEK